MEENIKNFNQNGYVVVKNVLNDNFLNFITQYTLFDEIRDFNPDRKQVIGAHSRYSDPAMETLLLLLQKTIEENTGLNLYPTYSFYRVYRPGNELLPHKDRSSCEISITLFLGKDYMGSDYEWPIIIENNRVVLEPGDLVCYKGIELEHWREKFNAPKNSWHSQAFLHYVDVNGPFSEYKYDQRPHLGFLPK